VGPRIRRRNIPETNLAALDLHPVLARVLAARGIDQPEELTLGLKQLLPPLGFLGLDAAATLLADSLAAGERIMFVGDFDADGATSIAVGMTVLRQMGATGVDYLVPNRFEFGYGLTPEIVELAAKADPALIVTVDNGISSIEGVARARELGIRTLVTDHHLPGAELPEADVIVNPNQPGCEFPCKALAGVGVIFYVLSALRNELRRRGWFEQRALAVPNLADVLDLDPRRSYTPGCSRVAGNSGAAHSPGCGIGSVLRRGAAAQCRRATRRYVYRHRMPAGA
jgi:single-stranded-DNA-specific exonuclease